MPTRRTAIAAVASLALAPRALAQPALPVEPQAFDRLMREGRYLPLWREVTTAASADDLNVQAAAMVGEEAVALGGGNGVELPITLTPDARSADAVAAIVAGARSRRVVMLNEAHQASRHRAFLARVVRALRPEGFDILTAETFLNRAPDPPNWPNIRALPQTGVLNPDMGYYTRDPVFADAVREAASLGYRLEPYEAFGDQTLRSGDTKARIAAREAGEAANLAALLQANPGSRVLVYCGFSHLRKTADRGGNLWMAARLREATGIDPLCISQSTAGSFGPQGKDTALARAVLDRFKPEAPIVVADGGVSVAAEDSGADLAVFHPSLPDVEGRPGWLAADPVRCRLVVEAPARANGEVVIVQAVHAAEPERAVPADQQVLARGERRATLYLRPGAYRLRLETEAGFTPLREVTV